MSKIDRRLPVGREQTGRRDLDAIQARARETAKRLDACPFSIGVLRSVAFVASVIKIVDHGLGVPASCMLCRFDYGGAAVAPKLPVEAGVALDPDNQLALLCDQTCTMDLWFYPRASEAVPR